MGITRDLIENERPTIESPNTTEDNTIGIGQIWQDVTSSRSAGVTYTNNTGKPIEVSIEYSISAAIVANYLSVDGVSVDSMIQNGGFHPHGCFQALIPNGSTYMLSTNLVIVSWRELRD